MSFLPSVLSSVLSVRHVLKYYTLWKEKKNLPLFLSDIFLLAETNDFSRHLNFCKTEMSLEGWLGPGRVGPDFFSIYLFMFYFLNFFLFEFFFQCFYSCLLTFASVYSEPYLALRTCFVQTSYRIWMDIVISILR